MNIDVDIPDKTGISQRWEILD